MTTSPLLTVCALSQHIREDCSHLAPEEGGAVVNDNTTIEDPIDANTADSDAQLRKITHSTVLAAESNVSKSVTMPTRLTRPTLSIQRPVGPSLPAVTLKVLMRTALWNSEAYIYRRTGVLMGQESQQGALARRRTCVIYAASFGNVSLNVFHCYVCFMCIPCYLG